MKNLRKIYDYLKNTAEDMRTHKPFLWYGICTIAVANSLLLEHYLIALFFVVGELILIITDKIEGKKLS